jgi:hypothetical protein
MNLPPLPRWRLAAAVGLLVLLTALVYGRSISYGLVLDDYNHRAELREGNWSFRSLVDASHLGGTRRRVQMWWQQEADLYFFRPLAFAVMRATYLAGGWRAEVMHAASLGWGLVCATLVLMLAWRTFGHLGWALLAAVVFLLHPNNFLAPRWIACQNEQMATAFTLAALLAYGRYSGWWSPSDGAATSLLKRRISLLVAVCCYVAALGCRESAIIVPALFAIGDLIRPSTASASSRWSKVAPYVLFAAIAVGYLVLRRHMLGPVTIPARPYAWPPGEPGFVGFAIDKFVYYILGLWAYLPIVGFAGQEQMHGQPGIFYGLFAAIVAGWMLVLWRLRPGRMVWLWLGLAILPLGPVLPVFASAHHLYLASAGMAVATVMVLRAAMRWTISAGRDSRESEECGKGFPHEQAEGKGFPHEHERRTGALVRQKRSRLQRWARPMLVALVPLHLLVFVGMQFALDTGVAGLAAACQLPIRQTVRFAPPLRPDDKLFFINLPMLAFNCVPAIEEGRGVAPLHGYVLTFAPKFLSMDTPGVVEQTGPRQLRVRLDEPGYFSGLIGRSILQGIDRNEPFRPGETFTTPEFTVEVNRATKEGVQEFTFTFARPLNDPTYHFFLASPVLDACPLRFEWSPTLHTATTPGPERHPMTTRKRAGPLGPSSLVSCLNLICSRSR